jgi:anaerobic dimethyl sulfoxide reductase subunit A
MGFQPGWSPFWNVFPRGDNPVKARIPNFLWTEAVVHGKEMGPSDGLVGADRLATGIKLIYAVASNCLINQHANINRTATILQDEELVEFIVVQDQFLTSSARYADIILPVCTHFETYGIQDGWKYGHSVILNPPLVAPAFETKSDYRICAELAGRLGFGPAYTEGRSERDWVAWAIETYRDNGLPDIPTLEEFEDGNLGAYTVPVTEPGVSFTDFRRDPENHPLPTPSGKIEIFSRELFEMGRPEEIPAVPKYIQEWESFFGPEAERFPLSLIGYHNFHHVHSTHDNVDWLEEAFPQRLYISEHDAGQRGLQDGDSVRVFNDRGTLVVPCRITRRIMPGVVGLPQGGWWTPDPAGVDRRGTVNVLTSERWTPLAFGNAQHTVMVDVRKEGADA